MQYLMVAILLSLAVGLAFLFWDKPVMILYATVIYSSVFRYLRSVIGLPDAIKYVVDIFVIVLFIQLLLKRKAIMRSSINVKKPLVIVLLFAIFALISYGWNLVINRASILFFVYGIRQYFRLFVIFFAAAAFFSKKDIDRLLYYLILILPLNVLLCCVQYFIQGLLNDYVGGLFGTDKGCNTAMNLYLIIVCAILIAWGINGKLRLRSSFFGLGLVLGIAAISELKALFFEVPAMLVLALLFTKFNRRAIIMAIIGVIAALFAVSLFLLLYPNWSDFFSEEAIREYTVDIGYGTDGALNRLRVIPFVMEEALLNLPERLFGLSLGSTEYFLGFASPFYLTYAHTYFNWFYYAVVLLETGVIGFALMIAFFMSILMANIRVSRKLHSNSKESTCMVSLIVCLSFFLFVYDQALRTDAAPILYVVLAMPFVMHRENAALSPAFS